MSDDDQQNKNVNNKVDVMYKIWLAIIAQVKHRIESSPQMAAYVS